MDLPSNVLKDLRPLKHLPYLCKLIVSQNQIETAVDFAAEEPQPSTTGEKFVGSCLEDLDISENVVSTLSLAKHTFLTRHE